MSSILFDQIGANFKEVRETLELPFGQIDYTNWDLDGIKLIHGITKFNTQSVMPFSDQSDDINLHFNLRGRYLLDYKQVGQTFDIAARQHNIMYSQGINVAMTNHDPEAEVFEVRFRKDVFLYLAEHGNPALQRFAEDILTGQGRVFSPQWAAMPSAIWQLIQQITHCRFKGGMKRLFLLSKSIELLVLQAESIYSDLEPPRPSPLSEADHEKLMEAKRFVEQRIHHPPSLAEVAKAVALNEYKLKKGFKQLFQQTVYGYLTQLRLEKAYQLLQEGELTASEIAFQLGYSSPQHFHTAFKRKFGVPPKSISNP
ncbi:MAG: AraC family transcriptional regulator [Saprospiraceae bacterium]|nr:AraC family transcriptional regulator [Saprospiraceae bacterium]